MVKVGRREGEEEKSQYNQHNLWHRKEEAWWYRKAIGRSSETH
jgi:hypothetical protein